MEENPATADPGLGRSAQILVPGAASGPVVYSDVPLSFFGVNVYTGVVGDQHHPLRDRSLADCVVAIPSGRGSCSASSVLVELLLAGVAPAALIFRRTDEILALGVMLAKVLFDKSIPVIVIEDPYTFGLLAMAESASITDDTLLLGQNVPAIPLSAPKIDTVALSLSDISMLDGKHGPAKRMAMETIVAYAAMQGAASLINVSQAHIDACIYVGKSSLLIPERLLSLGARLAVPTTCNSLSVDRLRWRDLGSDPDLSQAASKVGDAYLAMGATMSFTCAPYLLETKPSAGEQIGWAESNAVVFANSVLGARTQKYPDYMDVFIALTGRAPYSGCHTEEGRAPSLIVDVPLFEGHDESLFPLLGYLIGEISASSVPLIYGLERSNPTVADLKAFGAGFATTSSASIFHINGVTREAQEYAADRSLLEQVSVKTEDLVHTWKLLNSALDEVVSLVSLGNPHFAIEEFASLASICQDMQKKDNVDMIITTSRETYQKALLAGYLDTLEAFGARFITDTCWCMIEEPIISPSARNIMTNSSKYAHYGPGMVGRGFHFGSLAACVDAACIGRHPWSGRPAWLFRLP